MGHARPSQKAGPRTSQVAWWLGLHAAAAKNMGLIPGRGTKTLHATWCSSNPPPPPKKNSAHFLKPHSVHPRDSFIHLSPPSTLPLSVSARLPVYPALSQEAGLTNPCLCHLHLHFLPVKQYLFLFLVWGNHFFLYFFSIICPDPIPDLFQLNLLLRA